MTPAARTLSAFDCLRLQWHVTLQGCLDGAVRPNPRFWPGLVRRNRAAQGLAFLRGVRKKYGSRVWTWFPFGSTLLILDGAGIETVLASPENVADPTLKRLFLSTFTPCGAIISRPPEWAPRRALNDHALAFGCPHHPFEQTFSRIVGEEVERLLTPSRGGVAWPDFRVLAARISQRVIFGAKAYREDFSAQLDALVAASNYAVRSPADFAAVHAHIAEQVGHAARAGHGALATLAADWLHHHPDERGVAKVTSQVAFWLFVLRDAIELHTPRTLALIARAPTELRQRLHGEVAGPWPRPLLEACIYEQLRLWTPIPVLLRVATTPFSLGGTRIQAGQQVLLHAGLYHRDTEVFGPDADRFNPDRLVPQAATGHTPPLFVFSHHLQACAGQHLVVGLLQQILAALLSRASFELLDQTLSTNTVPGAIDHFGIRFTLR